MDVLRIPQFAEILEECYGQGIYRKIKVIPAQTSPTGRKVPQGEKSNMPQAEIITNRIGVPDWDNFSFSIKYAEELYCLDFDTKIFKDPALFDTLRELGAYHTETAKGWHFYINISGLPDYKNEINLGNTEYFSDPKDIDLIRQKRNVWEPVNREVQGTSFINVEWEDIEKYFDVPKMNFQIAVELVPAPVPVVPVPVAPAPVVVQGEPIVIPTCDEETLMGFMNRLKPERATDYESWRNIAMAIYTNFHELGDLVAGWMVLDEWSKKYEGYNARDNKTIWDGFANRPDNPLTYKSIRRMADEDSSENVYESIYISRGADALVEFINTSYIYNKGGKSVVIYVDNGHHTLKSMVDMANDLSMYDFAVEDSKGKLHWMKPADIWKHSTKRKCVKGIDFDPTGKKPGIYNLWKGYYITKENSIDADETMCQPILNHLKNVWCSGDENHFQYVLNWFAWVLQRPDVKIGVMLCIRSRQGGGKGTILDLFSYLMDGDRDTNYFSQCANLESIIGKFTTGIEGKCMINFDEAFWGGDVTKLGMIKNLITEPNQEIRVKNISPYNIRNTTAFILTTNEEQFAGITKDDRRHFCLECDDSLLDTKSKSELSAYFSAICGRKYNEPQNRDMCLSFAKVLYARDLSDYNPRDFPKTPLSFNQIQQGWSSVVKFWHHVLNTGVLYTKPKGKDTQTGWECRIDGEGEAGDWGWTDEGICEECPGTVDSEGNQLLSKNFIHFAYRNINLGGDNASRKEDSIQFWNITNRIFRNGEFQIKRPSVNGRQKRFLHLADIHTLRTAFKRDQKAEHLTIYEDEIDHE